MAGPYVVIDSRSCSASPEFTLRLAARRERLRKLLAEDAVSETPNEAWRRRSYPVLAVLAPVMSQHEGKIEFPGDPMCLYSALSYAVDQAVQAHDHGLTEADPYNDLCPRWGPSPSREYRLSLDDNTVRVLDGDLPNTDQTIFDPRIWNEAVRSYFVRSLLMRLRPAVVLISTVSPGHRYAIDIARVVREHLPDTLIVLGGRHVDETMRFNEQTKQLDLAYSSTLRSIDDGRIERLFDFLVSGQGAYALDLLMKSISIAMDLETRKVRTADVVEAFRELIPRASFQGSATVAAVTELPAEVIHLHGPTLDLSSLPSPYRHFGIRAQFPIFLREDGSVRRTGHMMVTNACPFSCNFCSEAASVVGKVLSFERNEGIEAALERVFEYCSYGAEAIFFDDSVFWGGNLRSIRSFAQGLAHARQEAAGQRRVRSRWLQDEGTWRRLADLQWGGQLTAEYLASLQSREVALETLKAMKSAGCNYIYMGIESLASDVMSKVHKNLQGRSSLSWSAKIHTALQILKEADLRVGASVLFGLDGETPATIRETIAGVAGLLDSGLLWIASPNILTYHPATAITRLHEMEERLDYHTLQIDNHPPYIYFEEAFPGVVSRLLSEEDIWLIHGETQQAWGKKRNLNPMKPTDIPLTVVAEGGPVR